MHHQLDERNEEARQAAATAPGLKKLSPLEATAAILVDLADRGNLDALPEWASKAELVEITGRSRDWLERADKAGKIATRVQVVPGARRLRTLYLTSDVRKLLEAQS